jgi:hypothetical protein
MNELIDNKKSDDKKQDMSIKIKYCECSFCSQFYFIRNQKYKKNLEKQKKTIKINESNNNNLNNNNLNNNNLNNNNLNNTKNNTIDSIDNDQISDEKKGFTLSDLDNITYLRSLNYDNDEISKKTNLSNSVVNYVINILYPKL